MQSNSSKSLYRLVHHGSYLQVWSSSSLSPKCSFPVRRLQDCFLVSDTFILYSEKGSLVLKLRRADTGMLVQSLRLSDEILKLIPAGDHFLVVMTQSTAVISVSQDVLRLIRCESHCMNPCAVGSIQKTETGVLACYLGTKPGDLVLQRIGKDEKRLCISAHLSQISALGISNSGRRIVSSSTKGTLLRLYDTVTGHAEREIRVAVRRQKIVSLGFSPDDEIIGVEWGDGKVSLVEWKERAGLLSMVPSFLLPSCQAEEQSVRQVNNPREAPGTQFALTAASSGSLAQSLGSSWFDIE